MSRDAWEDVILLWMLLAVVGAVVCAVLGAYVFAIALGVSGYMALGIGVAFFGGNDE